ncbi:hypothetical protein ICN46_06530 [Polynucleobacter sp. Latsch14-2]|uniref:hypothetical protein n=1 Tax=Polynucleobacter sp. Latsch14-2 TaxID=2576920 RepID=UPI001BFD669A|nr:hypothetical protein [Polynucleobacter sp. Latsch14-2]MBT8573486.1 hypothetical protein [Polynucleobacter paneuropaeus]MBT8606768.1 hypothetical protein [Polynucleobacter paneuropaeus]MBU3614545.1 hypothetical protein [Polynucleobacter sp. Latsch14-2]
MTMATCFNCGEIKFGAFVACPECKQLPSTDDDWMLSLAMTDHYFDSDTLRQMGQAIKMGEKPNLDESTRANLMKELIKFRESPMGFLVGGAAKSPIKKKWCQI